MATSGGPDSMTLLTLLIKIKDTKKLNIICAHVNHKLRKESDKEEIMVKKYAKNNNIIFETYTITNYKGNTENYARKKRYEFFEKLIKKYNATYLLTAHHGDDLTETILMRLIRGSSLKGYAGFSKITDKKNYKIYRPLITKTKEEILNYAIKNNIPYAIDKTNESDDYTRNRIRKLLPLLKKENKNIHLKFLQFSQILTLTEKHLEKEIENKKHIYKDNIINIPLFKNEDELIQNKIIYYLLTENYKENITTITSKHINHISEVIHSKSSSKQINLPKNKIFVKSYDKAYIKENKQTKPYNFILKNKVILPNNKTIEIIKDTTDNSNYITKLNSKDITLPMHIRTKKDGDKIVLKGLNKHKKIKDIFIDEKIPKEQRNTYPILTDDKDNILWLPGLKKTKFDKSKTKNYDIIIRYY